MEAVFMAGMLFYLSVEDVRKKTIPVIPMMIFGVAGVAFHLYYGRLNIIAVTSGLIPGVIAYIISVLTAEKIGRGDALLLMVTGIYMGFWGNVFMLWFALIFAAIGGLIAMAFFKKPKGYELPFVPFLLISFALITVSGGMPQSIT